MFHPQQPQFYKQNFWLHENICISLVTAPGMSTFSKMLPFRTSPVTTGTLNWNSNDS